MANPITWQNVNQGDASTAWRAMESAQRSINGAFDGLASQVTKSETINTNNSVARTKNNSQAYLDQVALLGKTPEKLQAAITDGSIDRLKASFGPEIDHAAVRGAAESLLDQRYKQAQQGIDFNNAMLNEKTAPVMDKFKSAFMAGDKDAAEKYRSEYAALGGKHGAELESFARTTGRQNLVWNEEGKGWVRDEAKHKADLANMIAQQQNARAMTGIAQQNANTNATSSAATIKHQNAQLEMTRQDRMDKRLGDAIEGLSKARSMEAGTNEGTAAVFDGIASTFKGDENGNANARRAFGEILKANPKISTADALTAVLTQDNSRWYKLDSTVRENTVDRAKGLSNTPESKARLLQNELSRAAAQERYSNIRAQAAAANPAAAILGTVKPEVTTATNPFNTGVQEATPLSRGAKAAAQGRGMASGVFPDSVLIAAEQADKVARDEAMEDRSSRYVTPPSTPKVTVSPTSNLEARLKAETQALNKGTINDLSPDIKAYIRAKGSNDDKTITARRKAEAEADLKRQLRESRIIARGM